MPELSIIVPTYHHSATLSRCLQFITPTDSEIIVVDDGSPTPVPANPRYRVLRHDHSRGRAATINTGLRAAGSDLVMILDDDICAPPETVRTLASAYREWNNTKGALIGRVIWDPDLPLTLTMRWMQEHGPLRDIAGTRSRVLPNLSLRNTMLWRPFILENGGMDERFTHYGLEDVELGLRLAHQGIEIRLLAEAVSFHHKTVTVTDLIRREVEAGHSAIHLHSKFPRYMPRLSDTAGLLAGEQHEDGAASAAHQLRRMEQEGAAFDDRAVELFAFVHHQNLSRGVLAGLRERGVLPPREGGSAALNIYNRGSRLQRQGRLKEARTDFETVLATGESEYLAGAHYHLGCIAGELLEPERARQHYAECLRFNPSHQKAREALKVPVVFAEPRPNVFERIEKTAAPRVLFVVFGSLGNVLNSFPVLAALRNRFGTAEITWLTLPAFAEIARDSAADRIVTSTTRGVIDWSWVEAEGFTHVFYPECNANQAEWEAGGLHRIDFMAEKCGVRVESHRPAIRTTPDGFAEAEAFMKLHGLGDGSFLTVSHVSRSNRCWPHGNLYALLHELNVPVVLLGGAKDPVLPEVMPFFGRPFAAVVALIERSAAYLGSDSGVSWLAATTSVPMVVFADSTRNRSTTAGYQRALGSEKSNISEFDLSAEPEHVLPLIRQLLESSRRNVNEDPGHRGPWHPGNAPCSGAAEARP